MEKLNPDQIDIHNSASLWLKMLIAEIILLTPFVCIDFFLGNKKENSLTFPIFVVGFLIISCVALMSRNNEVNELKRAGNTQIKFFSLEGLRVALTSEKEYLCAVFNILSRHILLCSFMFFSFSTENWYFIILSLSVCLIFCHYWRNSDMIGDKEVSKVIDEEIAKLSENYEKYSPEESHRRINDVKKDVDDRNVQSGFISCVAIGVLWLVIGMIKGIVPLCIIGGVIAFGSVMVLLSKYPKPIPRH